jgi:hypothetical protein
MTYYDLDNDTEGSRAQAERDASQIEGYGPDLFPNLDQEFPDCEICGDPIDFCIGHGSY